MKENVLFIFTDQWKADCLGFRGHEIVKTPNLDRLSQISTFYKNSYSVCPLCTPARGSIRTGLYPHQSGIIDNCDVGGSRQEYLPNSAVTWLDAMRDSGRKTGYFGKWHLGLDWQSTDKEVEFDLCRVEGDRERHKTRIPEPPVTERGQLKGLEDIKKAKKSEDMYPPFYGKLDSIEKRFEYRVTQKTLDFLERNQGKPWCLTASLVGPHFPNCNPEPFYSMYDDVDIPLPENMGDRFENKPWFQNRTWWPTVAANHFDKKEWQKTIRAYYGSITMMDHFIGQILDKAKECSGGRKTRVIFTADHGEMAGAHGRFDKGAYFYEEVIKTPLLMCEDLNGSQPAAESGLFCNTLDIAQTFFRIAGSGCENGQDLRTLAEAGRSQEVYSNYYKYNGHSFEIRTIRTERYKYSFVPQDIDELYDLENDPYEMNNLSDDCYHQEIKNRLKQKVLAHMKETGDYLTDQLEDLPPAGKIGAPAYPELRLQY